jgi:hypothetical protein
MIHRKIFCSRLDPTEMMANGAPTRSSSLSM